MSFFPIPKIDDVLAKLSERARHDIRKEIFSRRADKRRVAQKIREALPPFFDLEYIENVIFPALVTSAFIGERPLLPMIDESTLSKEEALPFFLWGLLYDDWEPRLQKDGLSVFIQGYENRGEDNLRKRIYQSAVTSDLYRPMYGDKIVSFFDELLRQNNTGKPFMQQYYDTYFDLYWDLHLGVRGDDIPEMVRQIGESFNTVLAYINPLEDIVYNNYIRVRQLREPLKRWIDDRINDLVQGRIPNPEKTFVYYWLKNGEEGPHFRRKDVVFECFHNFVALSQWGNTIYQIISRLRVDDGLAEVRESFNQTMSGNFDQANDTPFTSLDRFVMELFRTISPNDGSISTLKETGTLSPRYPRYGYITTPHLPSSTQLHHWENPIEFDPDRYVKAPTSDQIDKARAKEIGFAQCPFHKSSFSVKDGRNAEITNSAFGTTYSQTQEKPHPVCDYAGYAPFGFGYRRCPGELLTVEFIKDFLRAVWSKQVEFKSLDIKNPKRLPVGPVLVVEDNIGFKRSA